MTELAARTAFPPAPGPQQARGPVWIELYNFRFRLWPIVAAALLMEGILIAGRIPAARSGSVEVRPIQEIAAPQ